MKDTKMLRKLTEGKPTLGNQLTVILTILNLKKKTAFNNCFIPSKTNECKSYFLLDIL